MMLLYAGVAAVLLLLTLLSIGVLVLLVRGGGKAALPVDAARIFADLRGDIGELKEMGRETNRYAEQIQALQDLLKNPKQRGVLGEYFLEAVLKNVLPPGLFQMQYRFSNGEAVDAAVFIEKKIVPIDSKFSLENYNRFVEASDVERQKYERAFINDLKMRIEETAKYIRPTEGTMDFAFMFIASEGIYYDLLTRHIGSGGDVNLVQYAAGIRVIIVSPTSFLAYLYTVMQGLRALEIEKKAQQIEARVAELGRHLGAYQEAYRKLGNALTTAVNHYNAGGREFAKINKDVLLIAGQSVGQNLPSIEGPGTET